MILLTCAHILRAQPTSLPLSAFSVGYAGQTGSGRAVLAQVGNVAVGSSSGSGKVVRSGFLPGAMRLSGGTVDVPEPLSGVPGEFNLWQNYPNPFNPETRIRFDVPQESRVELTVYDILGRRVATLVSDTKPAGTHNARFDASDVSSGVYFYRLSAEPIKAKGATFHDVKKLVLVR
jgi:hypothetical protein